MESLLDLAPNVSTAKSNGSSHFIAEVLSDYWICCVSREASFMARKEVLTGRAKFGITGDGKELPQVALARVIKPGDFRAGYYRDQTLFFATGQCSVQNFFAQLYADANNDPFSGGRQMNAHFATPTIDEQGNWVSHLDQFNSSSDISSTGGQMARAIGLALASKLYRTFPFLGEDVFSSNGDELCICTIGDASTSEGVFWEAVNAAGVQKIPLAIFVWDDGYGISVPTKYQTTKGSISEVLEGFRLNGRGEGLDLYKVKAWDYANMCDVFSKGLEKVRSQHIPAIFHVQECTQPQGHSTSGSHERYKSEERLLWEGEMDGIKRMRKWILKNELAEENALEEIESKARTYVRDCKNEAWANYENPIKEYVREAAELIVDLGKNAVEADEINAVAEGLSTTVSPAFHDVVKAVRKSLGFSYFEDSDEKHRLENWLENAHGIANERYHTNLYSSTAYSALAVPVVHPTFDGDESIAGHQILNEFFDHALTKHSNLFAFGEDLGQIGDVNQGFAGLQEKYGESRVFDTGIREWTIMGQAIGMAMRGLRPIAEIQYLDYLIYGLQPLTDDLATLRYRSDGLQMAPAIIRTRGHRLEGIWHAGSPISVLLGALRGMYICVPRDMTQAAGMYNTLLQSDDPALVIECLNGYRLRERKPSNIGEYTVPLGLPEVLLSGDDVTLVTYGACVRIAQQACARLQKAGISVELIDVQTLLPFDLEHVIAGSLEKTNKIVFLDEDVPGGATSFMLQQVLENQNAFQYLDAAPITITAKAHRPPFGSDGDYFSKPNTEDVFEAILEMMVSYHPSRFFDH